MRRRSGLFCLETWAGIAALAFLIFFPLLLFFPALFCGKLIYGHDIFAGGLAFDHEVRLCLAAGQWPLWMPDVLGGIPGIASCNLLFLYPTDFFGCMKGLPLPLLLGIDATVHVALAGTGMFLFLRRLGRSVPAALLGAVFFSLSGSQISQLYGGFYNFVEGIAWVPWAFWASHKAYTERKGYFAWGLCGGAFAMQILAGAAQLFVYTFATIAVFSLSDAWSSRYDGNALLETREGHRHAFSAVVGLATALALASLLSAPQLWPTLRYLPVSARHGFSYAYFITGSIRLSDALTWVVPGFLGWQAPTFHGAVTDSFTCEYFGLLPWALAMGALSALWSRVKGVRWLAGLVLAAFFLAQCRWRLFFWLLHRLPLISGFRIWSRTLFLLTFAVCALAAFGWDSLREKRTRGAALLGGGAYLAVALGAAGYALWHAAVRAGADAPTMPWLVASSGSPGAAADILTALAKASADRTLALLLPLLLILGAGAGRAGPRTALVLALAFHGFDEGTLVTRFVRFTDVASTLETPRFAVPLPAPPGVEPWRIFDPDSANPNNSVLLGYENLYGDESVPFDAYVSMLNILQAEPTRFPAFMDLLNVRYIFRHSRLKSSQAGDSVTVFKNPYAFPRAWLVGKSRVVPKDTGALSLLADPGFMPRDEVALASDPGLDGTPVKGLVRWLKRSPGAFSLEVTSDRRAVLVVSNFWHPAWTAKVDGRTTAVLKADGGLQAIVLTPGFHQVDMRFDPALFDDALAVGLAGLVLLTGLGWLEFGPPQGWGNLKRHR